MSFLKAIGIEAAVKGFIIFFVYGFLTTIFIHFYYGLDVGLPESVVATLQGPISIYTFGWLSLVGLVTLVFATKFGTTNIDIENKKPNRNFKFSLPICEAAITLGVVIGATLLGVALASHPIYLLGWTQVKIYPMFYGLAIFMFFTTFPVAYFAIVLLDSKNKIKGALDLSILSYIAITGIVFFIELPLDDVTGIGVGMSLLMTVSYIFNNKEVHS